MSDHFVNEKTDAAAGPTTTNRLSVGESFLGLLDGARDNDWIEVRLTRGATYLVSLAARDPDDGGPLEGASDTVLEIYRAGKVVASQDDQPLVNGSLPEGGRHPRLSFSPLENGAYYLKVSSFTGTARDHSGGYRLDLVETRPADPNAPKRLRGGEEDDKLEGGAGDDDIEGGGGNDALTGRGGDDRLIGGTGDDTLNGGPGEDTIDGGPNDANGDTLSYAGSSAAVRVNLGRNEYSGGDAQGDDVDNIENVIGSSQNDWIRGNVWVNRLSGGAGDDTIMGGGGSASDGDILRGGAGDDKLYGGAGDDTLEGGPGKDSLFGGPDEDTISYEGSKAGVFVRLRDGAARGGDAQGDTYRDVENVTGSAYNDYLSGSHRPATATGSPRSGDNTLRGGQGNDQLYGGSGNDQLYGDAGNDRVFGGQDDDSLYGGPGNDWLQGGPHADRLEGGDGDDSLYGGAPVAYTGSAGRADRDTLKGGKGNDTLVGGAGDDALEGGEGDDILFSGPGADRLDGGAGEDTVSYANSDEKVRVDLTVRGIGGAAADPQNPSDADGDGFIGIENVIGSRRGDTIIGDDNANKLWGRAGYDTIDGAGGDDFIEGGDGGDTIDGGPGMDTLSYAESRDRVRVELDDIAQTSTGNEDGHAEGDRITNIEIIIGSNYADRIIARGDDGNQLFGGRGNDRIIAGGGNDLVQGGAGADTLDGDENSYQSAPRDSDTLSYVTSRGSVTINLSNQYSSATDPSDHYATGSGGDASGDKFRGFENIQGGMGSDRLTGDQYNNVLWGGPGPDTLNGGGTALPGPDGRIGTSDDVTVNDQDTISYANSPSGVTIDLSTGTGRGGDAEGDRFSNIERVLGSAHDDTFIASAADQVFDGGQNAEDDPETKNVDESKDNDTISYAKLRDAGVSIDLQSLDNIENLIGSDFTDNLWGDDNANRLEGGRGHDGLTGRGGNDILIGGSGNDTIVGGAGTDLISGGPGGDALHGYTIGGNEAADGRNGGAFLTGVELGEPDVNYRYYGDTASYADSTRGVRVLLTGQTGEGGYAEGDTYASIESVIGSNHDDRLVGNSGRNALTGGRGNDILEGGGERDVFIFRSGDGKDELRDFSTGGATDLLDLSAFNFNTKATTTLAQVVARNSGFTITGMGDDADDDGDGDEFTVIGLPGGVEVTLLGVDNDDLGLQHFIFEFTTA